MYQILFCFIWICVSRANVPLNFLVMSNSDSDQMKLSMFDPDSMKLAPYVGINVTDILRSTCVSDKKEFIHCIGLTEDLETYLVKLSILNGTIINKFKTHIISLALDQYNRIYGIILNLATHSTRKWVVAQIINYDHVVIKYIFPIDQNELVDFSNLAYDIQTETFIVVISSGTHRRSTLMAISIDNNECVFNYSIPYEYRIIKIYVLFAGYNVYMLTINDRISKSQLVMIDTQTGSYENVLNYTGIEVTTINYVMGDTIYSVMQNIHKPYLFNWIVTNIKTYTFTTYNLLFDIRCILQSHLHPRN